VIASGALFDLGLSARWPGRWPGAGWTEIRSWRPEQGLLWHLGRIGSASRRWLHEDSGLDALIRAALLA